MRSVAVCRDGERALGSGTDAEEANGQWGPEAPSLAIPGLARCRVLAGLGSACARRTCEVVLGRQTGPGHPDHHFDWDRGHIAICDGSVEVLALRLRHLDRVFGTAAGQFPSFDGSAGLARASVGLSKTHAETNRCVEEHLLLPGTVCRRTYSSRYARHFWSEGERTD